MLTKITLVFGLSNQEQKTKGNIFPTQWKRSVTGASHLRTFHHTGQSHSVTDARCTGGSQQATQLYNCMQTCFSKCIPLVGHPNASVCSRSDPPMCRFIWCLSGLTDQAALSRSDDALIVLEQNSSKQLEDPSRSMGGAQNKYRNTDADPGHAENEQTFFR